MKHCITCGDELHPERAEKYSYCTKPDCQQQNLKDLTIVSIGVNKSADQFMVLDEKTRDELARGQHHDPRRGSYGRQGYEPPTGRSASQPVPDRSSNPVAPAKRRLGPPAAGRRWTESQQQLAVLYNEQGLKPDEIAEKLGLSRYTVTQMILTAPRDRRR
jgi:DNA-directed RNA polymerase subunit N (RpoN/RPB10)